MRVIIAGGRKYQFTASDVYRLDYLHKLHKFAQVISGGAPGADKCGEQWAKSRNIPVRVMRADWKKHGKAAGPIRNGEMAKVADALIAFPGDKGTSNMLYLARLHDLEIFEGRCDAEEMLLMKIFG